MRSLRDWCGKVVGQGEARERGFILIVVISALGVLALVAASFAQITSSHVRTAASAVQSAGAEALADAGVQLAILTPGTGTLGRMRDGALRSTVRRRPARPMEAACWSSRCRTRPARST